MNVFRKRFLIVLAWLGVSGLARGQSLQDFFTNRETVVTASGLIIGSNVGATVEAGEPKHGGKTGGHSVWISWVAPNHGVVRFKTETSGFDTLLSAYQVSPTNAALDHLLEAARNDDSEELDGRESVIEFGVTAGQRYEIAVDGYFGAMGTVKMTWQLDETPAPPPSILSTTPDTTLQIGDAITLTVGIANEPSGTKYKWFFNGVEMEDERDPTLVIASMQVTNVGRYKLQIDVGSHVTYFALSTELQINTEGAHAFAESKVPDAPETALLGSDGSSSLLARTRARFALAPAGASAQAANAAGVVQGYTGSQIFNTTFATADPAEPVHCNTPGGNSYWLAYQPPANGTVTLDTSGSSYDTVMEVYTYNAPPTGYLDLIPVSCDHGSIPGAARVQFPVVKKRQYVVAVAGVNGARGRASLNYSLNTNLIPQAPSLTSSPQKLVVTNGADVLLIPPISGSPPLHFAWTRGEFALTNSYSPALSLPRVSPAHTGNYLVTVTNDLGTIATLMPLRVVMPTACALVPNPSGALTLNLPTQAGLQYIVEEAADLAGPWRAWTNVFIGDGQLLTIPTPMDANLDFFRIRVE